MKNDTVVIEVEIAVEKEAGDRWFSVSSMLFNSYPFRFRKKLAIDFMAPSDMFDAELSVGSKTIHVNKGVIKNSKKTYSLRKMYLVPLDAFARLQGAFQWRCQG